MKIPAAYHEYAAKSWAAREPSVFGRFDFAYDGKGPPKLLEYNADTPTALLESSVAQWNWLEQAILPRRPEADQFNSLHEKLIERWRGVLAGAAEGMVHFARSSDPEDPRRRSTCAIPRLRSWPPRQIDRHAGDRLGRGRRFTDTDGDGDR